VAAAEASMVVEEEVVATGAAVTEAELLELEEELVV